MWRERDCFSLSELRQALYVITPDGEIFVASCVMCMVCRAYLRCFNALKSLIALNRILRMES